MSTTCVLCGCEVSLTALDFFDRPDGSSTAACLGCLAVADVTAPDGGPLPWELTCEVAELLLANDAYDAGEAA